MKVQRKLICDYKFLIGQATYLIVTCSTRDTAPFDLCIMTFVNNLAAGHQ